MTHLQWGLLYVAAICLVFAGLTDLIGDGLGLSSVCLIVAGAAGLALIVIDVVQANGRRTNADDLNDIAQRIEDEHDERIEK